MSLRKITKIILASIIGIFVVGIIGYSLFMGVYHYTSGPNFCSKCHYAKTYVSAWEEAPHKNVDCLVCHEPSGPLGKLHSKGRGLNYYMMDKSAKNTDILTYALYINERNCIVCHTGENTSYPDTVRMDRTGFDHVKSIQSDEKCISCHRDTGHSTDIGIEEKIK